MGKKVTTLLGLLGLVLGFGIAQDCVGDCERALAVVRRNDTAAVCAVWCAFLEEHQHNDCLHAVQAMDDMDVAASLQCSGNVFSLAILLQELSNRNQTVNDQIETLVAFYVSDTGRPSACLALESKEYCSVQYRGGLSNNFLGLCLPRQCGETELYDLLPGDFHRQAKLRCGVKDYHVTGGSIAMIVVLLLFVLLVALGTVYEVLYTARDSINQQYRLMEEGTSQGTRLGNFLGCFSLRSTVPALLSTKRQGDFKVLDGVRVFSNTWIIAGHCIVFTLNSLGYENSSEYIQLSKFTDQAIPSIRFAVDTFFWMSGFVAAFFIVTRVPENMPAKVWVPLAYLNRYLRLTPMYAFIIFLYWNVIVLLNRGPFWDLWDNVVENCRNYWWTNLLYINNIVPTDKSKTCITPTWFLANDFQFFLILPWLILLYRHKSLYGYICIVVLSSMSFIASYIMIAHYHFSSLIVDINDDFMYQNYYIKPYFRMIPYLFGVISALLWNTNFHQYRRQAIPTQIPAKWRWPLLLCSCALIFYVCYGMYPAYRHFPPSTTHSYDLFYTGCSISLWSLGISILLFLCFNNQGGLIETILSWPVFVPFSKLTFSSYLLHTGVIRAYVYAQDGPQHFSYMNWAYFAISVAVITYFFSALIFLIVEKPCANLQKLYLTPRS